MADIVRGLMLGFAAGVAAGLLWIGISLVITLFTGKLTLSDSFTLRLLIAVIIMMSILYGAAGGICGIIYVILFKRIPGKTPVIKGIIFGIFVLFLLDLFLSVLYNITSDKGIIFMLVDIIIPSVSDILTGALYGFLLGKLWESDFQKLSKDEIIDLDL